MQPYYSNYSRLLDFLFFFLSLFSLSSYMWLSSLSSLTLFLRLLSLIFSLSISTNTHGFGGGKHGGRWVFLRPLSLSLSLFDLVGIAMFVGVWWWLFGGGGCLMVGINSCGYLVWVFGGEYFMVVVFDGWGLMMVGIDGGGYFVWVFDDRYLLVVCVWWWVLVVMSVLWWVNGGRWLEFDGSGCLLVVCVWWWVFVVGGGGAMVALVVGCFAVVNPWMGMGIQKNGYGEERQWIGERELNFLYYLLV